MSAGEIPHLTLRTFSHFVVNRMLAEGKKSHRLQNQYYVNPEASSLLDRVADFARDERPRMLIAASEELNPFPWLTNTSLKELDRSYDIVLAPCSSFEDLEALIVHYGSELQYLVIGAHGTPHSMVVRQDDVSTLNDEGQVLLQRLAESIRSHLPEESSVILHSCSTGQVVGKRAWHLLKPPIAQQLAALCERPVYAPEYFISSVQLVALMGSFLEGKMTKDFSETRRDALGEERLRVLRVRKESLLPLWQIQSAEEAERFFKEKKIADWTRDVEQLCREERSYGSEEALSDSRIDQLARSAIAWGPEFAAAALRGDPQLAPHVCDIVEVLIQKDEMGKALEVARVASEMRIELPESSKQHVFMRLVQVCGSLRCREVEQLVEVIDGSRSIEERMREIERIQLRKDYLKLAESCHFSLYRASLLRVRSQEELPLDQGEAIRLVDDCRNLLKEPVSSPRTALSKFLYLIALIDPCVVPWHALAYEIGLSCHKEGMAVLHALYYRNPEEERARGIEEGLRSLRVDDQEKIISSGNGSIFFEMALRGRGFDELLQGDVIERCIQRQALAHEDEEVERVVLYCRQREREINWFACLPDSSDFSIGISDMLYVIELYGDEGETTELLHAVECAGADEATLEKVQSKVLLQPSRESILWLLNRERSRAYLQHKFGSRGKAFACIYTREIEAGHAFLEFAGERGWRGLTSGGFAIQVLYSADYETLQRIAQYCERVGEPLDWLTRIAEHQPFAEMGMLLDTLLQENDTSLANKLLCNYLHLEDELSYEESSLIFIRAFNRELRSGHRVRLAQRRIAAALLKKDPHLRDRLTAQLDSAQFRALFAQKDTLCLVLSER